MKKLLIALLAAALLAGCATSPTELQDMSNTELCSLKGEKRGFMSSLNGTKDNIRAEIRARAAKTDDEMAYRDKCDQLAQDAKPKKVNVRQSTYCMNMPNGSVNCF